MNDEPTAGGASDTGVSRDEGREIAAIRRLARGGDLDEAAARLHGLRSADRSSEVRRLDLLGRVEAQRGHFLSALSAWQRVLEIEPENASAARALWALRRQMQSRSMPRLVSRLLLAMVVVVLAGWLLVWSSRTSATVSALRQEVAALLAAVDRSATAHAERLLRTQVELARLAGESNAVAGVRHQEVLAAVVAETRDLASALARGHDAGRVASAELLGRLEDLQKSLAAAGETAAVRFTNLDVAAQKTTEAIEASELKTRVALDTLAVAFAEVKQGLFTEVRSAATQIESLRSALQQREVALSLLTTEAAKLHMEHITSVLRQLRQLETKVVELQASMLAKIGETPPPAKIVPPQGVTGHGPSR